MGMSCSVATGHTRIEGVQHLERKAANQLDDTRIGSGGNGAETIELRRRGRCRVGIYGGTRGVVIQRVIDTRELGVI